MKRLPFPDKPLYICYHNKAFPVGIIEGNAKENILPWLCSKSIGLRFNTACYPNELNFADIDFWGVNENITNRLLLTAHKDLYDVLRIDFAELLPRMLDNNFYINGTHNERYIPGKDAYEKYDFMHDYLLIGYDEDSFISAGFLSDGQFHIYHVPKENMIRSLTNITTGRFAIYFLSYNESAVLQPDVLKIITDLEEYLAHEAVNIDVIPGDVYGIAAMRETRRMFWETMHSETPYIDKRAARVLHEHKWALVQIIEQFLDAQTVDPLLREALQQNAKRAQTLHLLGIKLQMTGNQVLLPKIDALMEKIIETELQWLPVLTAALKEKYM